MDPAGNVAQYAVYDANSRGECHWSTDHGDSGFESAQAQIGARMALKASMADDNLHRAAAGDARRFGSDGA